MPSGIPFIIVNDIAERFSFYGMRSILVVFMTQYLMTSGGILATLSVEEATTYYHSVRIDDLLPSHCGRHSCRRVLGQIPNGHAAVRGLLRRASRLVP